MGALALFIQLDKRGTAVLQANHLHLEIAQRHVIHRLEFAFDLQLAACRAHGNTGSKVGVGQAYRHLGITDPQHPLHAQQRRQIRGVADLVQGLRVPACYLLAIQRQALVKAIQLVFDQVDGR